MPDTADRAQELAELHREQALAAHRRRVAAQESTRAPAPLPAQEAPDAA